MKKLKEWDMTEGEVQEVKQWADTRNAQKVMMDDLQNLYIRLIISQSVFWDRVCERLNIPKSILEEQVLVADMKAKKIRMKEKL